jgi:hypothetical protein
MRDFQKPTKESLYRDASKIQDDVSFANWAKGADAEYPDWSAGWEDWCNENLGGVPPRIHNFEPNNAFVGTPYEVPPGPECCWPANLGPVPPGLSPEQIALINSRKRDANGVCMPTTEAIVIGGEKLEQ